MDCACLLLSNASDSKLWSQIQTRKCFILRIQYYNENAPKQCGLSTTAAIALDSSGRFQVNVHVNREVFTYMIDKCFSSSQISLTQAAQIMRKRFPN